MSTLQLHIPATIETFSHLMNESKCPILPFIATVHQMMHRQKYLVIPLYSILPSLLVRSVLSICFSTSLLVYSSASLVRTFSALGSALLISSLRISACLACLFKPNHAAGRPAYARPAIITSHIQVVVPSHHAHVTAPLAAFLEYLLYYVRHPDGLYTLQWITATFLATITKASLPL